MRKNNITLGLENIISFPRNITSHFTEKAKTITLVSIIIMLSFVNITLSSSGIFCNSNVSALSYSSNVGIGFTFNPTLSVNISPSNLVIDNLTPSITADSNAITVSVATNAAYGYTLSATVNSNTSNNGNNNNSSNSNLTHTNGTSVFSSIATDASLSSLTNDNTWGYSYRLSNNSNNNAWSNYSGLSNETSKILVDSNDQTAVPIDFKIAAKASETQPSGVYTGTIDFTAVSKHIPVSLAEAYASEGKTMFNGYYTMQDMTSTICSKVEAIGAQLQVLDIRDHKLYWIAKLADNHCWMTQNLDLDLSPDRTLTSEDTDLNDGSLTGIYSINAGYNYDATNDKINWTPINKTVDFENTSISGWTFTGNVANSANKTDDEGSGHQSLGNYYNWSAATASNSSGAITSGSAANSICAKNWRLPDNSTGDFAKLNNLYNGGSSTSDSGLIASPLWFVRGGYVLKASLDDFPVSGGYWTNTISSRDYAYRMSFSGSEAKPAKTNGGRGLGFSVRCLAR